MRRGWLATVGGSGILLVMIAVFAVTTARKAQAIYGQLSANDTTMQQLEIQLRARSKITRLFQAEISQ